MNITEAMNKILREHASARTEFKPMNSAHEGHAVIREEFDELWDEVKRNPVHPAAMEKEAVQLGAMVIRFLTEVIGAPPPTQAGKPREEEGNG